MTDELNQIYNRIYSISDQFKSHKDAKTAFNEFPKGYKYIYAIDYVDADLRNGGIYQLHSNSTWHLVPIAIEGAEAFELKKLAKVLKQILFYYYKKGQSKMKRLIPDDFFDDLTNEGDKNLSDLEEDYYCFFDETDQKDTVSLWEKLVREKNNLLY